MGFWTLLPISLEKDCLPQAGFKDSRIQGFECLFSKDFIKIFNILSRFLFFSEVLTGLTYSNSPNPRSSSFQLPGLQLNSLFAFHLNPGILDPLNPFRIIN